MKLKKIIMPVAATSACLVTVAPLAACSNNVVDQGVKATLAPESTVGVSIKESKLELNKDSTITLSLPDLQGVKQVYIIVGTTRIEKDKYSFDDVGNITIKAEAMTAKNVEVAVWTQGVKGLYAKGPEKTFEALDTFKASDLKVYPVYDDGSKGTNELAWNTYYAITKGTKLVENFDTTGYVFTRDDAEMGGKDNEFTITSLKDSAIASTTVSVTVEPRMEAVAIKRVLQSDAKYVGDTLTPNDITVEAVMAKDESIRPIKWSEEYTIWYEGQEIQTFGTQGFKFDTKGKYVFTIKSKVPNVDDMDITVNVLPTSYKNRVIAINNSMENVRIEYEFISIEKMYYQIDDGDEVELTSGSRSGFTLEPHQTVAFRGKMTNMGNKITLMHAQDNNLTLSGNILGLLDYGEGKISELPFDGTFYNLFRESTAITNISKDFLPIKNLKFNCYAGLFSMCKSLVETPELPATTLAESCYHAMFNGCESLSKMPELKATNLAKGCYSSMFDGCKSLTESVELPATTLTESCYTNMFSDCESLTKAPKLQAEILTKDCYAGMFYGCESLVEAPELLSTQLAPNCYQNMFKNCTNLTIAPALPAQTLTDGCYSEMFSGCESLTETPNLPATELAEACYQKMFEYCIGLSKACDLPATKLYKECYSEMYRGCTELKVAPKLYAETLANDCYKGMFSNCESLTDAPELPLTDLKDGCYYGMFEGCKALKTVPSLPATIMKNSCYTYMFKDCILITKVPALPEDADKLENNCYYGMFEGCEALKIVTSGQTSHKILTIKDIDKNAHGNMFYGTANYKEGFSPVMNATYYWEE